MLAVGVAACGNANEGTSAHISSSTAASGSTSTVTSVSTPPGSYRKDDGDKDNDDSSHPSSLQDDDRVLLAAYGNEASKADRQAVAAVVRSYYAAAAAGNGAEACSLLYPSLARGLVVAPGGPGQKTGNTCASVVAALYRLQHARLTADDVATMAVTDVHVKDGLGMAVVGFKRMPRGEILIERDGGVWKVDALFDSQMP